MHRPARTASIKHPKKISHLYSSTPPSHGHWTRFEQQTSSVQKSCMRDTSQAAPTIDLTYRPSLPSHGHVIMPKAAIFATPRPRRNNGDTKCLEHMSSRNCTAKCFSADSLVEVETPPSAPRPPRLPSPDLPELDETQMMFPDLDTVSDNESEVEALFNESADAGLGKLQRQNIHRLSPFLKR